MSGIDGKVVAITGASSGIGEATARLLENVVLRWSSVLDEANGSTGLLTRSSTAAGGPSRARRTLPTAPTSSSSLRAPSTSSDGSTCW